MGTFKNFIRKTNTQLSREENDYVDRIVETGHGIISQNKNIDFEQLINLALSEVIRQDQEEVVKRVQNASMYASDIIKDKYFKNINTNEPSEKNDEK